MYSCHRWGQINFDPIIIIMSVSTSRGINLSQFFENGLKNVTKKT